MAGYDIIIIGSGLGGLLCGSILSREGFSVCVMEKGHRAGGCLQTFRRNGSLFDTGMHYIGGLDAGQPARRILDHLGVYDRLKLLRLDEASYDIIRFGEKEFSLAMGYEPFLDQMSARFPEHRSSLQKYISMVREISNAVDPCNINDKDRQAKYLGYYSTGFAQYLKTLFGDEGPAGVLAGMSPLYAGIREKTPLYIPMMIHASCLNGSYRFVDGGSQLADVLAGTISANGGTVRTVSEVTRIRTNNGIVTSIEVNGNEVVTGRHFISDIHPKNLVRMVEGKGFTPAYIKRINALEETTGMFSLYLSSPSYGFSYENRNYYCYPFGADPWKASGCNHETWPGGYMVHFSPVSSHQDRTNAIILNACMKWEDVMKWEGTGTGNRGEDYEAFKHRKAEKLLFLLKQDFPDVYRNVASWYTSSPLTYRDYTGTYQGSAYGILKDWNKPYHTMILPGTHIQNLTLTGQNINTHGFVGVTIGALLTCASMPRGRHLVKKICHG